MRLAGVASLVALAGALAAPTPAFAVERVSLQLYPRALPGKPAWQLTGAAIALGASGRETLGVSLRRKFLSGRAKEEHALRHSLGILRTFAFDGERGRWRTQGLVGDVLKVNMRAVASGEARSVPSFLGCRGDFLQVAVTLRGTFVLRTRTRFFGTIRLSQLRGLVTYHGGGPLDCSQPPIACEPLTRLYTISAGYDHISVSVDDRTKWLGLSFLEPISRTGSDWYHWMSVTGFETLVGALPTLEVRALPFLPIVGSGTFTAREMSETTIVNCRATKVRGSFVGTFSARFTGWGVRTLAVNNGDAEYLVRP
jgi:hypothetical protein